MRGRLHGRLLVVDDQQESRLAVGRMLVAMGHEVELACDGPEALAKLSLGIDLVLLDGQMPGMDGFEVARRIRTDPEHGDTPMVMVTGLDSKADRLRAAESGVNDFIAKPVELTELRIRTASLLRMKEATDALKRHRAELQEAVARRTNELRWALEDVTKAQRNTYAAHVDTIHRLVLAAEYKDRDTAAHIERIGRYCALLGTRLGWSPENIEILRYASEMHDVGKIGIPDAILLKRGKLHRQEWVIMRRHPVIGARILHGSPSPLLQTGAIIARSHHERWDGSGYPDGLAGEAIPLPARICAVADVFDALTSRRPYRDALPLDQVCEMLTGERGRHLDARIVDLLLQSRAAIEEIQRQHRDPQPRPPFEELADP